MSYINCICGHVIRLGLIPNPQGFNVLSELVTERVVEYLTHLRRNEDVDDRTYVHNLVGTLIGMTVTGAFKFYECKQCGRIAVFAHPSDTFPVFWFQREINEYPLLVDSLTDLSEKLANGKIARNWQLD